MIKVGDLVKARKGGDLDCEAFEGEVGLALDVDVYELLVGRDPDELMDDEILVEWCGRPLALWENAGDLEKFNG